MIYPVHLGYLRGEEGNAYVIMGRCSNSMELCGASETEIDRVIDDMMSGDYDNLLDVVGDRFDDLDGSIDEYREEE